MKQVSGTDRAYLALGCIGILVHLALSIWRNHDAYFFADDFLNFTLAHDAGRDISFLLRDVFGQYVPLYRAANVVLVQVFGPNFFVAIGFLTACSAATIGLFAVLCWRTKTPIALAAALILVLASCWLPADLQRWWSAALHALPGAMFATACFAIAADPRPRLAIVAAIGMALCYAAAVSFFNGALLAIVFCGALRLHQRIGAGEKLPSAMLGGFRDTAPMLFVAVAFLVVRHFLRAGAPADAPPQPADIAAFIGTGLQFGLMAPAFGLLVEQGDTSNTKLVCAFLANAALLAIIVYALIKSKRSAWLWLGVVGCALLTLGIIGSNRLMFGPWMSATPRYNWITLIALFCAIAASFGRANATISDAPASNAKTRVGPTAIAAVLGAAALVMVANNISAFAAPRMWDVAKVRAFMRNFVVPPTRGGEVVVGDRYVPSIVTPRWTGDYVDLSRVSFLAGYPMRVTHWDEATFYLRDNGVMTPIAEARVTTWRDIDGKPLTVRLLDPFEDSGKVDELRNETGGLIRGWVNPLIARQVATRVVIVDDGVVIADATRNTRAEKISQEYARADLADSGFEHHLSRSLKAPEVYFVIRGELAVKLPS